MLHNLLRRILIWAKKRKKKKKQWITKNTRVHAFLGTKCVLVCINICHMCRYMCFGSTSSVCVCEISVFLRVTESMFPPMVH